jgi:diketogulonate reductase-like aldo/keto reductase
MIKLLHQGKAHSIGVSNYSIRELNELLDKLDVVVPAVNQVEFHPYSIFIFAMNSTLTREKYTG